MSMFDSIILDEFTMLDEGWKAKQYSNRKEAEKEAKKADDEAQYQKRFGDRTTSTTLRGKDLSDTDWDMATSGSVDHSRVKKAKMSTQDKINHDKKYTKEFEKAHIAAAREENKRSLDHKWGNTDKANMRKMSDLAYAADSIARHNRRHPNAKVESALMLIAGYESDYAY